MKKIKRGDFSPIIKEEIDLNNIIDYEDLDLELITKLLNEVISNYVYNTVDLLKLLKDNYKDNMIDAINNIKDYSGVRFNCCYATKILKEKLESLGVVGKFISYKCIGFSTPHGDNLIKEAHMSLLIVTKRNDRIYYIVLDPGLRIPIPLCFYKDEDKTFIDVDNDEIIIEKNADIDYTYSMEMTGYNRYSTNDKSYWCKEYFDVRYETINPLDVLFPISFQILEGYRIVKFSENRDEWALIKLMLIDKTLECYSNDKNVILSFDELIQKNDIEIEKVISYFTDKLNTNSIELISIIRFVINHYNEIIDNISPVVLKEFYKQKALKYNNISK